MARRDIDKLHDEIEELFADLWQVPRFAGTRRGFRPNVDSFHAEDSNELTVVVEVPGVDPESLNLVVGERMLVIEGERRRPKVVGYVSYQQMEIEYGPFQRQVRLPKNVDPQRAHARYENGMVTITLPVIDRPAPRGRVSIEVGAG
ncbi:MAG TPA: Hsp20/alpha crystallin family protein [Gaiellaceae bacterium]